MGTIITFASGKGGVGKSMLVANIGATLAKRGRRVVMADLDLGGSNLAALFGAIGRTADLGQFLARHVESLDEVLTPILSDLKLLATTTDALALANPAWSTKQRLLRHLAKIDADVVLVDVGAGVGNDAMDFFRAGDIRVLVSTPEPTATLDAYRFIKLSTIRDAASQISSRDPGRRRLERSEVVRANDLPEFRVDQERSTPWLVMNQADPARRADLRLRTAARDFLGRELGILGAIPQDEAVRRSVSEFLPVVMSEPNSVAAEALRRCASRLDDIVARRTADAMKTPPERASFRGHRSIVLERGARL